MNATTLEQKPASKTNSQTRKLTPADIEQFHRDGYLLVKGLFNPESLNGIIDELRALAARRDELPKDCFVLEPCARDGKQTFADPMEAIRKFQGVDRVSPKFVNFFGTGSPSKDVVSQILNKDKFRMIYLSSFSKPAKHGTSTPWHQDQGLWNTWMPRAISCWVAIDECTVENGCLQFAKGSHRKGLVKHVKLPSGEHQEIDPALVEKERANIHHLPMKPGDAVFFGGLAWHFSEPNQSSKRRLGAVAVYVTEDDLEYAIQSGELASMRADLGIEVGCKPELASKHRSKPLV